MKNGRPQHLRILHLKKNPYDDFILLRNASSQSFYLFTSNILFLFSIGISLYVIPYLRELFPKLCVYRQTTEGLDR